MPSLLLAILLAAGVADAQVPLAWEAPAACPDGPEVRARAERMLEGSTRLADAAEIRAEVRETAAGLRLTLRTAQGAREIEGQSCEVLADAAALIAAMAIDPEVVAAAELDAEPPAPEPEPTALTKPLGALLNVPVPGTASVRATAAAAAAVADTAESTGRPSWRLAAGALADIGVLPGLSLAPTVGVGVELGALRLEARGFFFGAYDERVDNHATAAGSISLVGGEARACAVALRGALELAPCGGLALGAMHAEGRGVSSPGASTALWAAASLGAQIDLPLADWLALRADLGALVALSRPDFVIDGIPGVVYEPAALAARLALGAEVRFR